VTESRTPRCGDLLMVLRVPLEAVIGKRTVPVLTAVTAIHRNEQLIWLNLSTPLATDA
jgi:hypothetical protein